MCVCVSLIHSALVALLMFLFHFFKSDHPSIIGCACSLDVALFLVNRCLCFICHQLSCPRHLHFLSRRWLMFFGWEWIRRVAVAACSVLCLSNRRGIRGKGQHLPIPPETRTFLGFTVPQIFPFSFRAVTRLLVERLDKTYYVNSLIVKQQIDRIENGFPSLPKPVRNSNFWLSNLPRKIRTLKQSSFGPAIERCWCFWGMMLCRCLGLPCHTRDCFAYCTFLIMCCVRILLDGTLLRSLLLLLRLLFFSAAMLWLHYMLAVISHLLCDAHPRTMEQ